MTIANFEHKLAQYAHLIIKRASTFSLDKLLSYIYQ